MNYPGSLHNHTDYSNLRLRDSTNRVEDLFKKAKELGHSVIAFTEHETISNAIVIENISQSYPDIKYILGNEIYLCRNGLQKENYVKEKDLFYHFILLAKDAEGHKQIRELSTRAWSQDFEVDRTQRIPTYYSDLKEIIGRNQGHVIGSTACLGGFLSKKIDTYLEEPSEKYYNQILNWCKNMEKIFGKNNFFIEMQPSRQKRAIQINKILYKISEELNIPFIITTDSHYLDKAEAPIHEAFLKSQNGEREVKSFYETTYMMDTAELESFFDYFDSEILEKAYKNIQSISEQCQKYSLKKTLKIPKLKWKIPKTVKIDKIWFDRIPELETFYNSSFDGDNILARAIVEKLSLREDLQTQEVYDELNSNLVTTRISSETNKVHWSSYYLNLQNIINVCWDSGTLVGAGRGSSVGFLLMYILDIIQINHLKEPIKCYEWRFLNPNRVSVLDIDTDIESSKRPKVLEGFRKYYGEDKVSNVITFGKEKPKSAIQTAARGLGINNDVSLHISSLIPSDRGEVRSLHDCFYGNPEKGFKPITTFVNLMTNEYPELWEVAQKIEGLICRVGEHAGGVIFVDDNFTEYTALMKAPSGDVVTQFDLEDCEAVSLIKMDLLSINALDKIHNCLDLLVEYGYIEKKSTLKETYESVIGIYNLERDNQDMWKMIWDHKIISLFQMEEQSGIQGIELIKPKNVGELAVLNSVIRLMAPDAKSDTPLNTWAKYRKDISIWYKEMERYGLTEEEIKWLANHSSITEGMCESQEGLMQLVREPQLGGNSLSFADKCRKGIAKKVGTLFKECEEIYYENIEKNNCSEKLAHYVWDVLLRVQRGYSFNRSHCLAYSLVGLQEMNLCFGFPQIFWNTAVLISESGSSENESEEGDDEKKKNSSIDYNKIAKAMGKIIGQNIKVMPPDINNSKYTYTPNVEMNTIFFGLKGILNVGDEIIKKIMDNRPYSSWTDFYNKIKPNKSVMISLIKCGAFDSFGDRHRIMVEFLWYKCDKKTTLNLRNLPSLLNNKLIPLDNEILLDAYRYYEFNRYLKDTNKTNKDGYFVLTSKAIDFLAKKGISFNIDKLSKESWKKFYDKQMDVFREYIKNNQESLLEKVNFLAFMKEWNTYCEEKNLSAWEMETVSIYFHEHELAKVNFNKYGIKDFEQLPREPKPIRYWRNIPIYNLNCICGTCIAKNKQKSTVYILTTTGVVPVKFTKEYFSMYDKRISEVKEDGKKKVIEDSWFNRGNKIIVQGIRRENEFVPKKYSSSGMERIYHIDSIEDNGDLILRHERKQS